MYRLEGLNEIVVPQSQPLNWRPNDKNKKLLLFYKPRHKLGLLVLNSTCDVSIFKTQNTQQIITEVE